MVIDLNPERGTRAKQATLAVQAERLSPQAPQNGDAIVRAHGKVNRERSAEMTDPDCSQSVTRDEDAKSFVFNNITYNWVFST